MPSVSENQSPPDCGGPFGPFPPFQCLRALGAAAPHDEAPFSEEVLRRQSFQDGNFPGPSHSGQRVRLFPIFIIFCSFVRGLNSITIFIYETLFYVDM